MHELKIYMEAIRQNRKHEVQAGRNRAENTSGLLSNNDLFFFRAKYR